MPRRAVSEKATHRYRNRVLQCRLAAGIGKQKDLAERTGIHRSTINALEQNELFLSSHYALLIAEVLGCTLDDLFERETDRMARCCAQSKDR